MTKTFTNLSYFTYHDYFKNGIPYCHSPKSHGFRPTGDNILIHTESDTTESNTFFFLSITKKIVLLQLGKSYTTSSH